MTSQFDTYWSAVTSYGIAVLGMVSTDSIMFVLGTVLLVVRLAYESIRLYRYIWNKGDEHE